jgi:hypothetical protein
MVSQEYTTREAFELAETVVIAFNEMRPKGTEALSFERIREVPFIFGDCASDLFSRCPVITSERVAQSDVSWAQFQETVFVVRKDEVELFRDVQTLW